MHLAQVIHYQRSHQSEQNFFKEINYAILVPTFGAVDHIHHRHSKSTI